MLHRNACRDKYRVRLANVLWSLLLKWLGSVPSNFTPKKPAHYTKGYSECIVIYVPISPILMHNKQRNIDVKSNKQMYTHFYTMSHRWYTIICITMRMIYERTFTPLHTQARWCIGVFHGCFTQQIKYILFMRIDRHDLSFIRHTVVKGCMHWNIFVSVAHFGHSVLFLIDIIIVEWKKEDVCEWL